MEKNLVCTSQDLSHSLHCWDPNRKLQFRFHLAWCSGLTHNINMHDIQQQVWISISRWQNMHWASQAHWNTKYFGRCNCGKWRDSPASLSRIQRLHIPIEGCWLLITRVTTWPFAGGWAWGTLVIYILTTILEMFSTSTRLRMSSKGNWLRKQTLRFVFLWVLKLIRHGALYFSTLSEKSWEWCFPGQLRMLILNFDLSYFKFVQGTNQN